MIKMRGEKINMLGFFQKIPKFVFFKIVDRVIYIGSNQPCTFKKTLIHFVNKSDI